MARTRVNPPAEVLYAKRNKIFAVMMIGWAMSLLDVSIVNVSVPELQDELDADIDSITWVVNAYNISFAVLLVTAGKLADQFGRRMLFMIGMAVFTLGSLLCAISPNVDLLVAARVLQGMGAGILAPIGFAITAVAFPIQERGKALATIAVVALAASASGPALGGAIVELASWHWIFLINVPFGILGIVLARRIWPETYDLTADRRIDLLGMTLLGLAVFCLVFGLLEANHRGWGDALILFLLQGSILLTVAFVFSQRRPGAMLTPGLVKNRQFVGANTAMALFGGGALGTLLLLALAFVNLWGFTIFEAALALIPVPVTGLLVWPKIAKAADGRPPRELAVPALALMALGLLWMSFMPALWDGWEQYAFVFPGLVLIGIGMGTGFPTINVGAMGAVQGQELGLASGILNTARQLGAAVGIALLIATFSATLNLHVGSAQDDVADIAQDFQVPLPVVGAIMHQGLAGFAGGSSDRLDPAPGFDEQVFRRTAGAARNAFGWSFRVAMLLILLAIPFARTMERSPAQARAAAMAAMQAAQDGDSKPLAGSGPKSGPTIRPGPAGTQPAS
ncbi:MAG TPA: MFS transporter [Thermoleophilaceae bacterium]|nr:MFS transporter [Thermoleophilaceae bacterium]